MEYLLHMAIPQAFKIPEIIFSAFPLLSSTHLLFFLLLLPLYLSPGWPQILCITEAVFPLLILLPPSARFWDYRTEPLSQPVSFLKIKLIQEMSTHLNALLLEALQEGREVEMTRLDPEFS